jgi:hypothetical protein
MDRLCFFQGIPDEVATHGQKNLKDCNVHWPNTTNIFLDYSARLVENTCPNGLRTVGTYKYQYSKEKKSFDNARGHFSSLKEERPVFDMM